jgi:hypothetical protein
MAPPGERNQYGYWEQRNGTSVWTWLPEYLLLRELLWNHHYMPVPSYEYDGYWSARRSGTTYYGGGYTARNAPAPAAPKYGTHGTFTEHSYANSRYMNRGGGYSGSQYGSHNQYETGHQAAPPSTLPRDQGHQFGRAPGSPSSGRRFGSGGGSRPHSAPSGRRFGHR